MTLPCLRCGKELKSAIPRMVRDDMPDWQPENQPSAGTMFHARGQYGSTVFDPEGHSVAGTEFLEINICDECMLSANAEGRVLYGVDPRRQLPVMKPWDTSDVEWCGHCGQAVGVPHERHYDEVPF